MGGVFSIKTDVKGLKLNPIKIDPKIPFNSTLVKFAEEGMG